MERPVTTVKLSDRFSIQARDTDATAAQQGQEIMFLDNAKSRAFYLGIAHDQKDAIEAATKMVEHILQEEKPQLTLPTSLTEGIFSQEADGFLRYEFAMHNDDVDQMLAYTPNHLLTSEEIFELKVCLADLKK